MILVLMGVCGSGKSAVGHAIVARTGWRFLEGDEVHSPENVAKMHAGIPLTDADRWPWLKAIAARMDAWQAEGVSGIVACSALKRGYRDLLLAGREDARLVYLRGRREVIDQRMAARRGHYMPASLVDSQFATLEEPVPGERPIVLDVDAPVEALAEAVLAALAAESQARTRA